MTSQGHTERAHAKLSASKAERWMNCPGSIRMCQDIEDQTTEYAAEGTAAHELAEKCLRTGLDAERFIGDEIVIPSKSAPGDGWRFTVDEDMAEAVQVYLDFVRPKMAGCDWDIEQRFDLSSVYPDMFGTGDLVIYDPKTLTLDITDYKHGRGHAVDAKDNAQLLYYAVGAVLRAQDRRIAKIRLTIVQPRCAHKNGPIRSWEIEPADLLDWKADLADAAKRTEGPTTPLVAGEWCKFCPAAGVCPMLYEKAILAAQNVFSKVVEPVDVTRLTPDELAERLEASSLLSLWVKRLWEYAHLEAEAGRCPPRFKLVNKRAYRKWLNERAAYTAVKTRFALRDEDILELRSPAQIEKFISKDQRGFLEDFYSKESSGTTLVHETDRREAVRSSVQSVFKKV